MSVQIGFVVGALLSAATNLADRMPKKTEELHSMMVDFLTEAKTVTHSTRDEPDPAPTTHRISTQAEFDALEPRVFNGGDEILFERGGSFEGALSLKRSAVRPGSVIRIADFGSAEAPRPVIRADADGMGTIDIRDSGGWTIENLELVNQSDTRSERHGIFVTASDSGTHRNFVVRNCLIRDVTGVHDDFNNGGIVFRVVGTDVPTKFDGVLRMQDGFAGVQADPDDPRGVAKPIGRHAHLNVVVRGNRVSDVTRNAIIIGSADAPLAEYNIMGPNIATETTGNTLYNYATDSALIQYNEALPRTRIEVDSTPTTTAGTPRSATTTRTITILRSRSCASMAMAFTFTTTSASMIAMDFFITVSTTIMR